MWLGIGVKIVNWWRRAANGPFSNHATLTNGLVSYWKLDEQSGVRYDSVVASANDLTDNNTVTASPAGPSGVVSKYTAANSESLRAGVQVIPTNSDMTVVAWIRHDVGGAINTRPWVAGTGTTDIHALFMENANGTNNRLYPRSGNAGPAIDIGVHAGNWFMQVYTYNHSTTVSKVKGLGCPSNHDVYSGDSVADKGAATADFSIGGVTGSYVDANIARVGVWSIGLSETEIQSLFNSGNGKSYASLTAAEKVGLVSYWNLDEASGTRADSHGSNTLTDNNTVTSVTNSVPPPKNIAAQFTAANSERLSKAGNVLSGLTEFTLNFWAKDHTAGRPFAIEDETVSRFFFGTTVAAGAVNWYIFDTAVAFVTAQGTFPTTSWGMVTVTYTASDKKLRVYLDGSLQATSAALGGTANFASTAATNFGAYLYAGVGDQYYNGLLDEPGIWSRVLTAQERTDLYNSGAGLFY